MSQLVTQPPAAVCRFELVIYERKRSWTVELTPGSSVTIGRSTQSTIHLEDMSVSRRHAELSVGDEILARDLGSSGGTTLVRTEASPSDEPQTSSNHRLRPGEHVRVRDGDVLRVGAVLLVLQRRGSTASDQRKTTPVLPVLTDPAMRRAYELVRRAAATDISVLILGETGVGKEVMAEAVHQQSKRAGRSFLKLNCAALADTSLESELFGDEQGAFTGALPAKVGLLESARGGTIFLDEIGELPLGTQAKLLRVLEERSVTRIGSSKPNKIDVRFVTATNRDLSVQVKTGLFRSDLYYRISGLVVRIPPLRQRPRDVEPLALHFLRLFCARSGQLAPRLSPQALAILMAHNWPGNVRELRNVMQRAALLGNGDSVHPEHILLERAAVRDADAGFMDAEFEAETAVFRPALVPQEQDEEDERIRIARALDACAGNQTRAARMLGISRRTLINRLDEFNLPRPKKAVSKR